MYSNGSMFLDFLPFRFIVIEIKEYYFFVCRVVALGKVNVMLSLLLLPVMLQIWVVMFILFNDQTTAFAIVVVMWQASNLKVLKQQDRLFHDKNFVDKLAFLTTKFDSLFVSTDDNAPRHKW